MRCSVVLRRLHWNLRVFSVYDKTLPIVSYSSCLQFLSPKEIGANSGFVPLVSWRSVLNCQDPDALELHWNISLPLAIAIFLCSWFFSTPPFVILSSSSLVMMKVQRVWNPNGQIFKGRLFFSLSSLRLRLLLWFHYSIWRYCWLLMFFHRLRLFLDRDLHPVSALYLVQITILWVQACSFYLKEGSDSVILSFFVWVLFSSWLRMGRSGSTCRVLLLCTCHVGYCFVLATLTYKTTTTVVAWLDSQLNLELGHLFGLVIWADLAVAIMWAY